MHILAVRREIEIYRRNERKRKAEAIIAGDMKTGYEKGISHRIKQLYWKFV